MFIVILVHLQCCNLKNMMKTENNDTQSLPADNDSQIVLYQPDDI